MSHVPRHRFTVLGIDPDTKATGLALVIGTLPAKEVAIQEITVVAVEAALAEGMDARRRLPGMVRSLADPIDDLVAISDGLSAIVVEAMAHRKNDPRPDNIVQLAAVEGMAISAAYVVSTGQHVEEPELFLPLPVDWKGTMGKKEHQERLLRRLHLDKSLKGVPGADKMKPTHKIHVVDAIGLAVWGLEQLVFEERKLRILR